MLQKQSPNLHPVFYTGLLQLNTICGPKHPYHEHQLVLYSISGLRNVVLDISYPYFGGQVHVTFLRENGSRFTLKIDDKLCVRKITWVINCHHGHRLVVA